MTVASDIREIIFSDGVAALLGGSGLPTSDIADDPRIVWFGAMQGSEAHGVIALQPAGTSALLRSLAVAPGKRRAGLGAALIAAAEEKARAMDLDALYLLTEDSGPYMKRHDFQDIAREAVPDPIRRLPQFAGICPASARCMRKQLGARCTGEIAP